MKFLNPLALPNLPIAQGATTPVPTGGTGSLAWSTTLNSVVKWNGATWSAISDQSLAQVVNGVLVAGDPLDAGVGSPDRPGFTAIVGDPGGDFAGTNLIEALMDDASGLGLGVRVLNPAKIGPDGAVQITDGKRFDGTGGAAGNITIIDTLGYACAQISSSGFAGTIASSNDLVTWIAAPIMNTSAAIVGINNTIGAGNNYIVPVQGRYLRLTTSTPGNYTLYLRSSLNMLGINWTQSIVVGNNLAGPFGSLVVGGGVATGGTAAAATAGNPLKVAGVDTANIVRQVLADPTGALVLAGYRLPAVPDTKTTNPLPAYVPPPPVRTLDAFDGGDLGSNADLLQLIAQLLRSIDLRLQELPGRISASVPDRDDFVDIREDKTLMN